MIREASFADSGMVGADAAFISPPRQVRRPHWLGGTEPAAERPMEEWLARGKCAFRVHVARCRCLPSKPMTARWRSTGIAGAPAAPQRGPARVSAAINKLHRRRA